jgi:hypothetical protein
MNRIGLSLAFAVSLLGADSQPVIDPVINNERVTVRDITLTPGTPVSMERHQTDFVTMFLVGGKIRTTANGKSTTATRNFSDAILGHKGAEEKLEVLSGSSARLIIIDLKDNPVPPVPNKSGLPNAFPRPRSKKRLETDRLIVWNYTWLAGVPTPMHYHDKDVVVVYRYDGSLKSTPPKGEVVVNDYPAGGIRFNKADRAHTEELVKGQQSAMILELK